MAEESQYNVEVTEAVSGLHTDNEPMKQPKGTYRYALNAVNEDMNGKQGSISIERSNYLVSVLPDGFKPIGDKYIQDDTSVIISTNPITGRDEIGLLQKDGRYTTLVNALLDLSITNQCDIEYRLRRGNERVIYWVDGLNFARTFNLDRIYNFYTAAYQNYLKAGGDPNTYPLERWDITSFNLIKTFTSIPFFANVDILEIGAILPGSYNFAIQYVDEDLNPTEWITTSNTVNIFNDSLTAPYHRIRGSRNVTSDSQSFPRANKSIKLTITNLDNSFPYYRIAIIRAAGNSGEPDKVLASTLYPTTDSVFIYSGNDASLAEVTLEDILINQEVIFAPRHISQLENRLQLAHVQGKGINWCEFQKFASKISSDLVTKEVILNTVISEPNVKNAKSTFMFRGYMPGEVYSFGICYVFSDGYVSPVFHIPGKGTANTISKMKVYDINNRYIDAHNCSTSNYWGVDSEGETLVAKRTRHHRFPFRKEVNKPLFTKNTNSTTINKYRLKMTITLATGKTYPVGTDDLPLVIPYIINYQVEDYTGVNTFNGNLVSTDLGVEFILYDELEELDNTTITDYGELDPSSALATYMPTGDETFVITYTYEEYPATSIIESDTSEIFGIQFSNIEKPHPDVVGIYIVRNERTEEDRIVLDNAIIGPMTSYEQYKSFGLLMPKQFYPVNNCGRIGNTNKTINYYDKSVWFFNPEFQFFGKKTDFVGIEIEGDYAEDTINMPTISDTDGSVCNGGSGGNPAFGSKGVYINDVQAGTSYNPEAHKKKDKDDDGFDLLIGYRNTNIVYASDNLFAIPNRERVIYLSAASFQNFESNTFYNVSVDNKIGIYIFENAISTNAFYNTVTKKNHLKYGALLRNSITSYSNYINRSYYKEHNNPILFTGGNNFLNGVRVFNGDAQISSLNIVSSVFYDIVVAYRAKKSRVWKIIVGAVLVIVGVVVGIYTGGAGLTLSGVGIGLIAGLAISYGISMLVSGIKFEQFKSMIDIDYSKGLKETVVDGGVYETIREDVQKEDDTIRWFADRVSNLYIESSVPFGLRSGLTAGVPDFIDAPGEYDEAGFRTYLTEKLTILDRDQGSGRLYKGYPTAEVYDMNLDYMRFNKQKNFIHLPLEYDCCSDDNEIYPTRVWYSEQSFQEERTDNYRVFLPNNYRDVEGEHGEITDLYRLGNSLFIHTREALWHLPQNNQERVTNEIVSFIGTGAFFSIPPRKVVDDSLGSGGTQHKWGTIKTRNGVVFVNEVEGKVYLHADKVSDISSKGMRNWFENNFKSFLSKQLFDKFSVNFKNDNNPANKNGIGYLSTYDTRFDRVIITKRDYLVVQEKLDSLFLFEVPPTNDVFAYCTSDGNFYQGSTVIDLDNPDYFQNKSNTLSYSFHTGAWISFHSYLPNYYIHGQNNLYSTVYNSNGIWKHNRPNTFRTFYTMPKPFIVELVKVSNPLVTTITEDITIQSTAEKWDADAQEFVDENFVTFNKIQVYTSKQSSGELIMKVKDTAPQPEKWYQQQLTTTPGEILITRKERNWNINSLRDYVVDYSKPIFRRDWMAIRNFYPIDKVPNTVHDLNKPWQELQSFRDKYIAIRLKFDTFDNVNIVLNYTLETEQTSNR